ncbi:hypothetical protein C7H10_00470 [Marinobacter shengliensis]|nr:hypothetical protein C7H10_00470 [Marinobacter shengliensis]
MVRMPYVRGFNNRLHSIDFPPFRGSKPAHEPGVKRSKRSWSFRHWKQPCLMTLKNRRESLQFEIDGEIPNLYQCHCSRCRKATGAAAPRN